MMPFQVKTVGRHVCLCRYHLQWQYLVEGFYNYRVHLRRCIRDLGCKCTLTSNPFDFRRGRVCERDEDADRFDKRDCMLRKCQLCAPKSMLCDKEQLPRGHEHNKASWNAWRKVEYERKDKSIKEHFDFIRVKGEYKGLSTQRTLEWSSTPCVRRATSGSRTLASAGYRSAFMFPRWKQT